MTNARSRNKNEINESNPLSLSERPHIQQQQSKKSHPQTHSEHHYFMYTMIHIQLNEHLGKFKSGRKIARTQKKRDAAHN